MRIEGYSKQAESTNMANMATSSQAVQQVEIMFVMTNIIVTRDLVSTCDCYVCSFSKLHPALADKHYLRTSEENQRIHKARFRMLQQQQQSTQHGQTARPSTADAGRGRSAGDRSNCSWSALKQVCCMQIKHHDC